LISVLLQPQTPENSWQPLASIVEALQGNAAGGIATVIDGNGTEAACGDSVVAIGGETRAVGVANALLPELVAGAAYAAEQRSVRLATRSDRLRVLYAPLLPIPRVLILGAGLDAVPLVNVLAELGWRVSVADHRPAYLERKGLARAEAVFDVRPDLLTERIKPANFDAIVVMSHHLATDRAYLGQLAGADVPYLGLLGPPARKRRLLDELGESAGALGRRLRGPVGIDIGADTAESIAVSIAAESQQVLVRAGDSDSRQTI
jgi:xanthine/CO dehydrogenase XdhC/CoxF family maturation factor